VSLVEDELGRFRVWAASICASADAAVSASLDNRLRHSPKVKTLVVQLLDTLQMNLEYGMQSMLCLFTNDRLILFSKRDIQRI